MRGFVALTMATIAALVACSACSACSRSGASPPAASSDAGAQGCQPGELSLDDGTCQPAGIPPEMCGAGFASDGNRGCSAILPPGPCPKGLMAVPGETQCHEVAPCADGDYGDIPVEASTQFVSAAYAGGASDGSRSKPWTTIGDGVKVAAPGAIVAIAAGSYGEDVVISGKRVRLWGRCPRLVEIVGTGAAFAAVEIEVNADGSEVRALAVRGNGSGLALSGSKGVAVDSVWVHDTARRGIDVDDTLGATRISVNRSLVERARDDGVFVSGPDALIEATVVRDTQPRASDQTSGRGIQIQNDPATLGHATATVRGSVVEGNREMGIVVDGSDVTIEGTVVRSTLPLASDQHYGRGIDIQDSPPTHTRASVTVRGSAVESNRDVGVAVIGSDATIEATVVRGTQPLASDQRLGIGIVAQGDLSTRAHASVTVRACLIEENRDVGVAVVGSDATIEATIVRGTQPQASDQRGGVGVQIQDDAQTRDRASTTVRACRVEQSRHAAIVVKNADATIDATLVRATEVQASDGAFGDGIAVLQDRSVASAQVTGTRIETSARAGLSNFGASVTLSSTTFECNTIDLDGEKNAGSDFSFDTGAGGNACGCGGMATACEALSSGLQPPPPIQTSQ